MLFRPRGSLFFILGVLIVFWVLSRDNGKIVHHIVEPFRVLDVNGFADTPKDTHVDQAQVDPSSNDISQTSNVEAPKPQDILYPPNPSSAHMDFLVHPSSTFLASSSISIQLQKPTTTKSATIQNATSKDTFKKEYDNLGLEPSAGIIYGNTLESLVDVGAHADHHQASLKETNHLAWYSKIAPLEYNPYPEYNSEAWRMANEGTYAVCEGAEGPINDVLAFSGHTKAFADPHIGSYELLDIDNNLCFERETRLGTHGHVEAITASTYLSPLVEHVKRPEDLQTPLKWEEVKWGNLQDRCLELNLGRFIIMNGPHSKPESLRTQPNDSSSPWNNSHIREHNMIRRLFSRDTNRETTQVKDKDVYTNSPVEKPPSMRQIKSRTAIILRAYSGKKWNENDKQTVRSIITELSLRSGGEYQVFLFVHIKNSSIPIWNTYSSYNEAIQEYVPKEFHDIAVLWNDQSVQELYPAIPKKVANVHQSQWMSVQQFAQDFPQFDHYWNWELDTRYTGHHYDLLEKLSRFATAQPRKYLWERNERYYIPSIHGNFDSDFRDDVEKISGQNTVWGAPITANVTPTGPSPPVPKPEQDNYEWGVGEDADYISVAPIFDPNGTDWVGKNDVWGYGGHNNTPLRATIITHSRVSRKLLRVMHEENLKGNHVSSEMTPQTVALLHGLKAVYAPVPIFLDRAWNGTSLERWFNPGPQGQSGSTTESPFGWGKEKRFLGSTWYYRAIPPARLYNNWMGWEDHDIGGPEWENIHGRPCLPPLLLHPIKNSEKVKPGHATMYDFP